MQDILVWRLAIYSAVAIPSLAVGWAWVSWWRQARNSWTSARRVVALVSILTLTVSAVTLLLFPEALGLFAGKALAPWDDVYLHAIRVGFWAGLTGTLVAPFAGRPLKWRLVVAGGLLITSWFVAGQSV